MFRILFLAFLLVPLLEIYLLIKVGGVIGAWPTVFLVVLTAVVGAFLLRLQGFSTLARMQAALARGELPAQELLEGAVLLVAGALLLTPGFFTDALGFCALVPKLRQALARWLMARLLARITPFPPDDFPGQGNGRGPRVLDGEWRRED